MGMTCDQKLCRSAMASDTVWSHGWPPGATVVTLCFVVVCFDPVCFEVEGLDWLHAARRATMARPAMSPTDRSRFTSLRRNRRRLLRGGGCGVSRRTTRAAGVDLLDGPVLVGDAVLDRLLVM